VVFCLRLLAGFALSAARASGLVFCFYAGLRLRGAGGLVFLPLRWHPRVAFVLQASPLCGAAPTFLCRRKEK